jgi:hypothetical protein
MGWENKADIIHAVAMANSDWRFIGQWFSDYKVLVQNQDSSLSL